MIYRHILFILGIHLFSLPTYAQQALTIVPVADLIGEPSGERFTDALVENIYKQLPYCGERLPYNCQRIHQLLFNEMVIIEEEREKEVRITVPNVFFNKEYDTTPYNSYWSLKKNFITTAALKKHGLDFSTIPQPISYEKPRSLQQQQTVALTIPYYEPKLHITFSAGTRFIKAENGQNSSHVKVFVLDPKKMTIATMFLPKKICITQTSNHAQQQKMFVALIRQWAHLKNGFIPYVWGGCSFTHYYIHDNFITKHAQKNSITWYERPHSPLGPLSGFDCTGLIARAAQLCAIPYFFKNTSTLAKHLTPLTTKDTLKEGDLLWFPGHAIVITDIAHNLIVESRAYSHGYGKVHEIPLCNVFKDINNFSDILDAYYNNKPLYRLTKTGTVAHIIPTFKLLKLASVWHQ